jgi:DNA repair exonuclease SbcCD nuclease subunit
MSKKQFNILSCSDIHLGHRRTDTKYIINNLNKYICNDKVLSNIDLLILAGDVFDSQLTLSSPDIPDIDFWIANLLRLCNKHNVVIRVLEGTPSHDRMQSERFITLNNILSKNENFNVNLQYVTKLSIEYISDFDINVLYVPDEWNASTDDTLSEVKDLILSKGLKQVDYAVMHGTMDFQLPSHIKNIPRHNSDIYCDLVKNLIFVGHIHQHSIYKKIISHGSFERLSHGEEEAKGFIKVSVEKDNHHEITFVENKESKKFITLDAFDDNDVDVALSRIDNTAKTLPEQSYVRIRCNKNSNISSSLNTLKQRWPLLIWSILNIDDEDKTVLIIDDKPVYVPIIINKNNISSLVEDRLKRNGIDNETLSICKQNLSEVI